ncbi:uncharacterized protein LOC130729979 isoform X2 [Lotus japonicus]|uniref:uncharacterized protein LOC130729979 isoform X2 n=1 Tax=Lotus japonicus TaxID=34305 RepID=UPI002584BEEB|nr:uncharacterized protein LOC130729979 isoform X2 [Lotus japonicus]
MYAEPFERNLPCTRCFWDCSVLGMSHFLDILPELSYLILKLWRSLPHIFNRIGLQIFQSKAAAMRSCGDAIATINSRLSKKPPKVLASLPPQKEASEMKTTTTTTRC